jgi:acyl-CoA synthetase (AMP-forming)/AMP-acid ligase II
MSAATLPFLLDSWAAERADAVAIAALSRPPLSYAAFAAATRRVAEGLSRQGIGPGDRVALLLPNRPEAAILLLALARLSAIAVPLDPRLGVEEIAGFLSRARPSAVATGWGHAHAALPRKLAEVLPDSRAPLRFVIGLDAGGVEQLAGLPVLPWKSLDAMPEHAGEDARAEAAFLALPAAAGRLALHSQQAVASHARAVAERLGLEAASAVLPVLPFATPTGMATLMATLLCGARLLCQEEEGAGAADSLARAHGATHLLGWPAVLAGMAPLAARRPYAALGFAGCVGAVPDAAESLPLQRVWGIAETQGLFATAADGALSPVAPAELRLGAGLDIQSPSLLTGWLGEDSCHAPDGTFFSTGLPARLEANGFVLADAGVDGPLWLDELPILPAEVAHFLSRQPGVEEAVVTAASPAGPLVGFVRAVPEAALEAAALTGLCQHALAAAKVPARIAVVEALPAPDALAEAAGALLALEA